MRGGRLHVERQDQLLGGRTWPCWRARFFGDARGVRAWRSRLSNCSKRDGSGCGGLFRPDVEAGARNLLAAQAPSSSAFSSWMKPRRRGDEVGRAFCISPKLARAESCCAEVSSSGQLIEDESRSALSNSSSVTLVAPRSRDGSSRRGTDRRPSTSMSNSVLQSFATRRPTLPSPTMPMVAVVDVAAHEGVAVVHRGLCASGVIGLDDLLRQHQHHGEPRCAANRVRPFAAGPGSPPGTAPASVAVLDIDGGRKPAAAGRYDQQVRRWRANSSLVA